MYMVEEASKWLKHCFGELPNFFLAAFFVTSALSFPSKGTLYIHWGLGSVLLVPHFNQKTSAHVAAVLWILLKNKLLYKNIAIGKQFAVGKKYTCSEGECHSSACLCLNIEAILALHCRIRMFVHC